MIQTGIKTNKVVSFIKDNLSLIVILPAFIGGLWQSIELMSISTPYIRFFSVSQIIPDGILILLFFLTALAPVLLIYYFEYYKAFATLEDVFKEQEKKPAEKEMSRDDLIFGVIVFLFIYSIGIFLLYADSYSKNYLDDISSFIFINGAVIFICNVFLNICYENSNDKGKKIFKLGNLFLMFFYVWVAFSLCKKVHKSFLKTENFENISNVDLILNNKYPNCKREILYFNDKYMFVKIIDAPIYNDKTVVIEKIYILPLDTLFNKL